MSLKCVNLLQSVRTQLIRTMSSSTGSNPGEKTALYNFHVANQGKMVNFAGYLLPVQYGDMGITASHLHTRKSASIFDVSHMLQTYVRGKDAIECFESICTADIRGLSDGNGSLTVFTNETGGILDDLIVTRISSDLLYIVSNAGRKQHDMDLMRETVDTFKKRGRRVDIEFLDPLERALLAVQGPNAVKAVAALCFPFSLDQLYFMNSIKAEIAGTQDCRITRCGYTGEDGVEISIPGTQANRITELLLSSKLANVKMAGLGARDSLRLEAGMCLYGSDIDEKTTPIEAGLAWLIPKRRRNEANFRGSSIILQQLKSGPTIRRVGIRTLNGPPARHGVKIFSENNSELVIGEVTSGCPSPSLGGNIAMGYVQESTKKIGTKIQLEIRGKFFPAEIVKMPFIQTNYYNKPKVN